jgi:hypothetical protein
MTDERDHPAAEYFEDLVKKGYLVPTERFDERGERLFEVTQAGVEWAKTVQHDEE